MKTADGSPRRRAIVSISAAGFFTSPFAWSTRTRTSAMSVLLRVWSRRSDELLGGEELGELGAAIALVGDDGALLARGALGRRLDRGPGIGEADLPGVDAEVGEAPLLDRLLLRGHDP